MLSEIHCTQCGEKQAPEARFCPRCGSVIVAAPAAGADPYIGKIIADRFLLTERIGKGASGTIYRAEHTTLKRKMAVKILHPQLSQNDAAVERFRREATTVGQIDNDHILQVLDFGRTEDQRLFFAMELLEGETLAVVLEREGKLAVPRVIKILSQVASALGEAHAHGYIHRDLRPRNLFLSIRRGEPDFVKLLDFGLSKLMQPEVDTKQTATGMSFGDPRYMSPEQARGDSIDTRSDVFSLGIVGYEMLTGATPFAGSGPFDVLQKVLDTAAPRIRSVRPDCPQWLDGVLHMALQKKPDDRFASMTSFIANLRAEIDPDITVPDITVRTPPIGEGATLKTPAVVLPVAQAIAPAVAPVITAPVAWPTGSVPVAFPTGPAPSRTLIMPTALSASVAAAANAALVSAVSSPSVREPAAPVTPTSGGFEEETNPGRRPQIRELAPAIASTAPAGAVAGEVRSTIITPPPVAPTSSVVIDESFAPMKDEPTGPHRVAGDDGWFSERAAPIDPELFEEPPPKSRSPMIIGIIAGALSLGVFATLLLWPRGTKPETKQEAPVAAAVETPAPPPTPTVTPLPPEPVVAVAPTPTPTPTPTVSPTPTPTVSTTPTPTPVVVKEPVAPKPEPVAVAKPRPEPVAVAKPRPEPVVAKPPKNESTPKGFKDPYAASAKGGELDTLIKGGRQKLGAGDLAQAQASFNKARELDSHSPDAYAGLGEVAFEQGDYNTATVQLKQAIRLSPNRARFLVLLGQSYYKLGRAKDAATEYRRALRVDPTNQEAQRSLELAERKIAQGG